jgi:hypothetical protein
MANNHAFAAPALKLHVSPHRIWVKLDSAREEYQHAIGAHPDQSMLTYLGAYDSDLTFTVARGQLPQILSDYDKVNDSLTNLGLTKTTYSPGTSNRHDFVLVLVL